MKKLILCAIPFFCTSCADLQFPRFNDSTSVDSKQSSPTVTKSNNSKSANKNTKNNLLPKQSNVNTGVATNKTNSSQFDAKSSNSDRASVPDWVSQMKQDMKKRDQDRESSKSADEKELDLKYKEKGELMKDSESVYKCPSSYHLLTIFFTNNGIKFRDSSQNDITKSTVNVKTKDNIVYFEQTEETDLTTRKIKFALDKVNKKLVELSTTINKVSEQKSTVSFEFACTKLK